MDLSLIIARLQAAETSLLEIGGSAGLDAAMRANRVAPAAYLVPLGESAVQIPLTGSLDHLEHQLFGVVFVVACFGVTGEDAVVDLAVVRREVKNALIGFVPFEESGEPVVFKGGEVVQFEGDGRLWWSDEYQLDVYWRN